MQAVVAVVAVVAVLGIELFALSRGIDGVALAASVGAVSAIGGYYFKGRKRG